MMRIRNKDWWEVVLFHLTVADNAEWKESFKKTGHAFTQHFIQNEELLVVRVIRHTPLHYFCVIANTQSFQFRFSIQSSVYMHTQSY